MNSADINVALIGYGYAGKTFHAPLIASVPGMKLKLVVSSDAAKVRKDWTEVEVSAQASDAFANSDIDLVVIATPNETHFSLAQSALEANKHVVVDKPFTVTTDEARRLQRLSSTQARLLSVFHNRRWDGDFLTLGKLIKEGHLGEVMNFESHFDRYRPEVRQRWREGTGAGSGLWYDLGPHVVDQALELFGMPDSIYGDMSIQRQGAQAVDYFHVIFGYGKKRVTLHASTLVAADTPRFAVHGTLGSFVKYGLDTQEDALKCGEMPSNNNWGHDPNDGTLTISADGSMSSKSIKTIAGNYPAYYQAIRDAINGKAKNPVPADEAIAVMEILELAIRSAATGQALTIAKATA